MAEARERSTRSLTRALKPCTLSAIVKVANHSDNRILAISWYSDDPTGQSGLSEIVLEGDQAPVIFDKMIKELPKGAYTVYANLLRVVNGKSREFVTSQTVTVTGIP